MGRFVRWMGSGIAHASQAWQLWVWMVPAGLAPAMSAYLAGVANAPGYVLFLAALGAFCLTSLGIAGVFNALLRQHEWRHRTEIDGKLDMHHRDERRSRLRGIISDKSLIKGREMRLASGRLTDIYFDLKPTMLHQEASNLLADEILDIVQAIDFDSIGGLSIGAVPLIQSVIVKSYGKRQIRAFFVRSELKEHGTKELIEANFEEKDRVIILDDVTTTGGSVLKAIDAVRSRGANVMSVITIVDRQEGAKDRLERAGIKLIPLFNKQDFN